MNRHLVSASAAIAAFFVLVIGGSAADSFTLTVVSQTNSTITFSYPQQPGYGYLYSANGVVVSRTNDPAKTSVKFAKGSSYEVAAIVKGTTGSYPVAPPPPPPPPPPSGSVSQTITDGATITGTFAWRAVFDANGDSVEDDPGSVRFLVDAAVVLEELNAPFGDTAGFWNSTTVSNAVHTFKVEAVSDSGTVLASNTVTATVNNATPPPPPPPPPTGYPDASNTGVPSGVTLTTYTGPSNITTAGTVIDSKSIGCITLSADNITIKNSRVRCNSFYALENNRTGFVIQDTEVDCLASNSTGIGGGNLLAVRVNVHGCENGFSVNDNATVRDSYIHDLYNGGGSHLDGIQFDPFVSIDNVTIQHNTIYGMDANGEFGTSAIIDHSFNANSNILIDNNLMAGGAFTLYCSIGFTGTNYRVTNNHFSTKFKSTVGYYGISSDCADQEQSGNVIHETGAPVQLG